MLRFAPIFFLSLSSLFCVLSSLHWAKDKNLKISTFLNSFINDTFQQ